MGSLIRTITLFRGALEEPSGTLLQYVQSPPTSRIACVPDDPSEYPEWSSVMADWRTIPETPAIWALDDDTVWEQLKRAEREKTVDQELLSRLLEWRWNVAVASSVPELRVLDRRSLVYLATKAPGSLEELAACPGIGRTRLRKYGHELLEVI